MAPVGVDCFIESTLQMLEQKVDTIIKDAIGRTTLR